MVKEIKNFLTEDECNYLIKIINNNNVKSGTTGGEKTAVKVDDYRTSSTCYFDINDENVINIKNKIANRLKLDVDKGEPIQGQLYRKGEYFKKHNDWFAKDSYEHHCLHSGNRTHTFMIYLNDEFEGGETKFELLDKSIKAEKGKAVFWQNLKEGMGIQDVLHSGEPIKNGKKYIITSWWRENNWDGQKDYQLKNKTFSTHENFPRFSKNGFSVVKVPNKAWNLIKEMYKEVIPLAREEVFVGKEEFIKGNGVSSEIMSLENVWEKRNELHKILKPVHENWINQKLTSTAVYGIRSYLKGATLKTHMDKLMSHHVSSIIIVDKNLDCGCVNKTGADWPLSIQGHDGRWHEIYAKTGEMILYESAACEHGRIYPFEGEYFRNMFVHYKLTDWTYEG